MALPYFFTPAWNGDVLVLSEDTSKHIVQVLRKQNGDRLLLTDGMGSRAEAVIIDDNRKRCTVQVLERVAEPQLQPAITVAIAVVKNASRMEWFLEKATEIGINRIIPLVSERTEKEKFRHDRMQQILVSAMIQSQQCWLPQLTEPVSFTSVLNEDAERRFIAHCVDADKCELRGEIKKGQSSIILIGPEGDFTENEIEQALAGGWMPVAIGSTRLRTETAGIVAATLLRQLS